MKKVFCILLLSILENFISAKLPWDYSFENNKGVENYKKNNFKEASKNFDNAYNFMPNNNIIRFNKAATLYKQKKYTEAQNIYLGLLKDKNIETSLKEKTYYNLGNTMYRMAEQANYPQFYGNSLAYYQKALDINSEDKKAKENYDFVKKKIEDLLKNNSNNNSNNQNNNNNSNNSNNQNNSQNNSSNSNNSNNNGNKNENNNDDFSQPFNNSAIEKFLKNQRIEELLNHNLLNKNYNYGKQKKIYQTKDW